MLNIDRIIALIDAYLETKGLNCVKLSEVYFYLEKNGAFRSTKGQLLRRLLRAGRIPNATQPGGKGSAWYICHSGTNKNRKQDKPNITAPIYSISPTTASTDAMAALNPGKLSSISTVAP